MVDPIRVIVGVDRYYNWIVTMPIHLHKYATTASTVPDAMQVHRSVGEDLALWFGTTEQTVEQLRRQQAITDRNTTARQLYTTLTLSQRTMALHKPLLILLNYLLVFVREFLNVNASRYGSGYQPRRPRFGHRRDLKMNAHQGKQNSFTANGPGNTRIELKYRNQWAAKPASPPPFLAIGYKTVAVSERLSKTKTSAYVRRLLLGIDSAGPLDIRTVSLSTHKKFGGRPLGLIKRLTTSAKSLYTSWPAPHVQHNLRQQESLQNNILLTKSCGCVKQVLKSYKLRLEEASRRRFIATFRSKIDSSQNTTGKQGIVKPRRGLTLSEAKFTRITNYLLEYYA